MMNKHISKIPNIMRIVNKILKTIGYNRRKFPKPFNPAIYKRLNEDLSGFNNQQLAKHYEASGRLEGRRSSPVYTSEEFIKIIDFNKNNSLEIGPLHNPLLDHSLPNVKSLDHLSREDLVEKYRHDENVDTSKIGHVDYVWNGEPFKDLIDMKFENVLASHVVEHTPDLIGFFNNISGILKPNGFLFLIVPDKRYCFDHFREETLLIEVIYAHHQKMIKPSFESIIDMNRAATHSDPQKHWKSQHGKKVTAEFLNNYNNPIEHYLNLIKKYNDEYIDTHVWKFTPESFEKISNYLFREEVTDLKTIRLYPTVKNSHQFYVVLQKKTRMR